MRTFAAFLILASVTVTTFGKALPKGMDLLTKEVLQECLAESKIPEDVMQTVAAGEFSDRHEFKCYLKCLLKKLNLISDTSEIDYEGVIGTLPSAFVESGTKMVNVCHGRTGTDACDTAWKFNQCLYKSNPVDYFRMYNLYVQV